MLKIHYNIKNGIKNIKYNFFKIFSLYHINNYQTFSNNYVDNPKKRKSLITNEKSAKNVLNGFPWIYSNDILNAEELYIYSPCLVNIKNELNEHIAIGIYNKNSTIASRILSKDVNETINEVFFIERIKKAYIKRLAIYQNEENYRIVNAESDNLPGIIIDKYGKILCVQINASGISILLNLILNSIEKVLLPETIILRNDSHIRKLEKLPMKKEIYKGFYNSPTEIRENGLTFFVDILNGQKTGWYFDQRNNRIMLIPFCKNKNVLDLFSYIGSFGITLAYYGATSVTCVDSSYQAIKYGIKSAHYNNVLDKVTFVNSCVKLFLNLILKAELMKLYIKSNMVNNDTKPLKLLENNVKISEQSILLENTLKISKQSPEILNSTNINLNDKINSDITHFEQNCNDKNEEYQKFLTDLNNLHVYQLLKKKNKSLVDIEDIEKLLIKNDKLLFLQKKYDVILIDPPPLAKTNSLVSKAMNYYEKLLFISFKIVNKPGIVFISSCNSLIGLNELNLCIKKSLKLSKCEGVIISEGRMSEDHPIHISLPQTKYLTSILLLIT